LAVRTLNEMRWGGVAYAAVLLVATGHLVVASQLLTGPEGRAGFYLVVRSSYVPTWLGILLVPAGLGYIIDSFGLILVRDYSFGVAAFTFVGEALLMLWLLVRGRRIRLRDEARPSSDPRPQLLANGATR